MSKRFYQQEKQKRIFIFKAGKRNIILWIVRKKITNQTVTVPIHAAEKVFAAIVLPTTGEAENFRHVISQMILRALMTGRWTIS